MKQRTPMQRARQSHRQDRIAPLEFWGGIECTVNRVGSTWFDQVERSGHLKRQDDLETIRGLGIRKLRYGLHWERYAAAGTLEVFAPQLEEMTRLGIDPIAGLVHHGSGPHGTSLLDPAFGEKLAAYALLLARRYPQIGSYTPVNEPHTTARFSGLYGHWYPHHRSFRSYVRALINQLRGSVLAMRAIRTVRPDAEFVHTEDGGKTWGSPSVRAIVESREHRRWLGTDLLCGCVDRHHPLFHFLLQHGVTEREIFWFADNPCPPTVLGLNYYVTSDRYLDARTWMYPEWLVGGDSGDEPLADIEAVRVRADGIAGAGTVLREAWDRYHLPVAITEAHLGGPPDEQVRWLAGIWNEAKAARAAGADVRAVTAWALLGSFDWCTLVTRHAGIYEPGVFDVRAGKLLATPLTRAARQIARTGKLRPQNGGWWTQPDRFTFDPASEWEAEPPFITPDSLAANLAASRMGEPAVKALPL